MTVPTGRIDALCDAMYPNKRIHSSQVYDELLRDTLACGLIREMGNEWYVLTESGRDYVLQCREDWHELDDTHD